MKNLIVSSVSILVASLLIGCGGGDSDGNGSSGSYLTGDPVPVTTLAEAENAVSSVSSLNNLGTTNVSPSPARSASPSQAPVNESESCVDGGSYSISGDASETTADITYTYNNCNQSGVVMDGSQHVSGTNDGTTVNLDITMTALKSTYASSSQTMDMAIKYIENTSTHALDMIMNGTAAFSISSPISDSGTAGYQDFHIVADGLNNTLTLNGDVSTTSSAHSCVDGQYNLKTLELLTPSGDGFSSGKMEINGATFDFNNDGTATVTFADGSTEIVQQGQEVVCN